MTGTQCWAPCAPLVGGFDILALLACKGTVTGLDSTPRAHDSQIGESYYSWEAITLHISREEAEPKIEVESCLFVSIRGINHIY